MDILLNSLGHTGSLILKMGTIMFISLFGTELLMQLGAMKYLKPLAKPVTKISNLPSASALAFLTGIGSIIAAHTVIARFHQDGKVTDKELIMSGVLNTVPFHFKEVLTFHFPVILPLLGVRLCMIYITAFWLTGLIKLALVIVYGRMKLIKREETEDVFAAAECNPEEQECIPRTVKQLFLDAFNARKKLFSRMIIMLAIVTLIVQILVNTGIMKFFDSFIEPVTSAFGLPPSVIGPVSVYILSPTVGITYMSNLLQEHLVTEYQAIVALLAGGILMTPITRLRGTLPRYTAIFGFKSGFIISGLNTGISMLSRAVLLVLVMLFWS